MLRLRMSGAILPLLLYAFKAWTGATLPFLFPLWLGLYKVFFFLYRLMYGPMCAGVQIDFYACMTLTQIKGNAKAEKVIHQPLNAEAQIQYWANPNLDFWSNKGYLKCFFFLLELQHSLASIIPQMFHTHSVICHWYYITLTIISVTEWHESERKF